MIRIENLNKSYNGHDLVLRDVNLNIEQGSYIEIVGKSGSGKSTFLNTIGLLDSDFQGKIFIDDMDISQLNDTQVSIIRNKSIGFIFQSYNLVPRMTTRENIMLPFVYSHKKWSKAFVTELENLIDSLQISHLMDKQIQYLSGGEKQRVSIARALSLSPKLVLADEPTGNLDSTNGEIVFETLLNLKNNGTTVILVTHNSYIDVGADKILSLEKGRFM